VVLVRKRQFYRSHDSRPKCIIEGNNFQKEEEEEEEEEREKKVVVVVVDEERWCGVDVQEMWRK